MELLQQTYLGNTLLQWSLALGVALFVFLAFQVAKSIAVARLKKITAKTVTDLDDFAVELLGGTKQILILVLALYAGTYMLELEESMRESVRDLLDTAAILVFLLQAALWGNQIIGFAVARFTRQRMAADDPAVSTIVALMGTVSRIVFFTMIVLVALGSVGFDVTALVTGVGIGGIAIAMAVQGILADLFGSLTIALDKPFEVGDFITVGEFKGTVEHVGLKSTRLRSNTGEQLVLSNGDLLSSRMRNYKRMSERRGVIAIGVTYQTSAGKLEAIPGMIKQTIDEQPLARFDRAHFASFGDFSLNFEVVFWVTSPAYPDFMDTTQAINLDIVRRFEAEGIEFAYPTQTVFVEKEEEESEKKKTEEEAKNKKEEDGS
jgi:small-conductance mechanosensitive channel